jgi:CMP-N,N'-diacetyllegionaminic acid synthase
VIEAASVLAVIAARGGSKGVPGKNLLPIGGRPMIVWTIEAARGSRHIDRLVLSSDDQTIMDVAEAGGCEVPFRRDAALAGDEVPSSAVVADALERVPGFDIVVLLQPTSPLRNAADIDGTLALLVASGAPACVTVRAAQDHPYLAFRLEHASHLAPFLVLPAGTSLRRQDLPQAWCLNGAVYAARAAWFMQERTFLSPHTVGYPMPPERSLDIDTAADFERFRRAVEQRLPHG